MTALEKIQRRFCARVDKLNTRDTVKQRSSAAELDLSEKTLMHANLPLPIPCPLKHTSEVQRGIRGRPFLRL